ncbi:hypothetical protein [Parafrankia sp. EAN1pec]
MSVTDSAGWTAIRMYLLLGMSTSTASRRVDEVTLFEQEVYDK